MNKTNPFFINKEDEKHDVELENLLETYIKKSEELEKRESNVLHQVELIQSAVASLQAWKNSRMPLGVEPELVPVGINEIEEETKKIRLETLKIQQEIEQKITENKLLEEVIEKRKLLESEKDNLSYYENMMDDNMMTQPFQMDEAMSRSSVIEPDVEPYTHVEKFTKFEDSDEKSEK